MVTADDRRGTEPLRCGSCVHRRHLGGHARAYPKGVSGCRVRVTYAETSDVRGWWPACTDRAPATDG